MGGRDGEVSAGNRQAYNRSATANDDLWLRTAQFSADAPSEARQSSKEFTRRAAAVLDDADI